MLEQDKPFLQISLLGFYLWNNIEIFKYIYIYIFFFLGYYQKMTEYLAKLAPPKLTIFTN